MVEAVMVRMRAAAEWLRLAETGGTPSFDPILCVSAVFVLARVAMEIAYGLRP